MFITLIVAGAIFVCLLILYLANLIQKIPTSFIDEQGRVVDGGFDALWGYIEAGDLRYGESKDGDGYVFGRVRNLEEAENVIAAMIETDDLSTRNSLAIKIIDSFLNTAADDLTEEEERFESSLLFLRAILAGEENVEVPYDED